MGKDVYSPVWKVIILSIVTLFIYNVYWVVTRKQFFNRKGAKIPTCWLMIIPIVNYYFYYKLCEGWGRVCKKQNSDKWIAFVLWLIIPFVGVAFMQDEINNKFYGRRK